MFGIRRGNNEGNRIFCMKSKYSTVNTGHWKSYILCPWSAGLKYAMQLALLRDITSCSQLHSLIHVKQDHRMIDEVH